MPDRVLRDELLTSERYWSVSIEAQRLFVHLLLVVDDAARFTGKNFSVRAACFPGQAVGPEKLEKLLIELTDADLVRPYMVNEERFLFIPRFRNRRRYLGSSRYPAPPNGINDIPLGKADLGLTEGTPKADRGQPKVRPKTRGVGVGVGVGEGKTSTPVGFDEFWSIYPRRAAKPKAQRAWIKQRGSECLQAILEAVRAQSQSEGWTKDRGQFVPMPASWLNDRRWEDEGASSVSTAKPWELA